MTAALTHDNQTTLQDVKDAMSRFAEERDWLQFHAPKNLAMGTAIEAAELMEHFQWLEVDASRKLLDDPVKREAIQEELADVLLFVVQFASVTGIDLAQAAADKLVKNAQKYPVDKARGSAAKYTDL
jgi:dCTP diphosphatase